MLHRILPDLLNPWCVTRFINLIDLRALWCPPHFEWLPLSCIFFKLSATGLSFHLLHEGSCFHASVFAFGCLPSRKKGRKKYLFICHQPVGLSFYIYNYRPLTHKWKCKYSILVSTLNTVQYNYLFLTWFIHPAQKYFLNFQIHLSH